MVFFLLTSLLPFVHWMSFLGRSIGSLSSLMHFNRDLHIRMGARQLNWLRFEHYKRVTFSLLRWRTLLYRFIFNDVSLSPRSQVFAYQKLVSFSKFSRGTRHSTRCWVSGRARQTSRRTHLARMHYRAALSGGFLPSMGILRP